MRWRTPGKGPFGAIVWKEWRESFNGGLLALAVMTVYAWGFVLELALRIPEDEGLGQEFSWWPPMLLSLIAFCIGRSQSMRDGEGDAWSFLVQRPMRRSALFWAKVIAGLSIYLVSSGLPLLVGTLWTAMPGHAAQPYGWRILLPVVADLTVGIASYFAGFFGGVRTSGVSSSSRAFSIRGLSGILAIVLSIVVSITQEFWTAWFIGVVAVIVLAVAGRAAFIAGGRYDSQPAAGRAASGITIAVCIGLVGFGVMRLFLAGSSVDSNSPDDSHGYALTSDGSIVKTLDSEDQGVYAVRDLTDHPIERFSDRKAIAAMEDGVVGDMLDLHVESPDSFSPGYRTSAQVFERLNRDPQSSTSWYYMYSEALFVEFDPISRSVRGWLGPEGYCPGAAPPARRFEGEFIGPRRYREWHGGVTTGLFFNNIVTFSGAVYRVDLKSRSIETLFKVPSGELIVTAHSNRILDEKGLPKYGDRGRFDTIATTRAIYVQTPGGAPLFTAAHDPEAAGYGMVYVERVLESVDSQWVVWYSQYVSRNLATLPEQVTAYNNEGVQTRHYTLPLQRPVRSSPPTQVFGRFMAAYALLPITVPAAMTALRPSESSMAHELFFYVDVTPEAPRWIRVAVWVIPALSSIVSAALIFAWGRKCAFPRRRLWFWTMVGILLGPWGLVLMFALFEWPFFEACPACRRYRVITHAYCEHCGAPFRLPEPDGTEIFEFRESLS